MRRAHAEDDVAAVFADRAHAEAAVSELCEADVAAPHLAAAVHSHERRVFELDVDAEYGRATKRGVLAGMPLGALAGVLIVVLAVRGSDVSWTVALAGGALPGLLAGGLFGGFAGVLRTLWLDDDIDRWDAVALGSEQVLVVARAHGRFDEVRSVLQRHGGRWLTGSASAGAALAGGAPPPAVHRT